MEKWKELILVLQENLEDKSRVNELITQLKSVNKEVEEIEIELNNKYEDYSNFMSTGEYLKDLQQRIDRIKERELNKERLEMAEGQVRKNNEKIENLKLDVKKINKDTGRVIVTGKQIGRAHV